MKLLMAVGLLFSLGFPGLTYAAVQGFRGVSFKTADGGHIFANLYGEGEHAVILAHGAVFDKERWHDQARELAEKGLRVLPIDFRGYGNSTPGESGSALHEDILGAILYLQAEGAKRVSLVGGSMGGGAAARAAALAKKGQIDRLILLAHAPISNPEDITAGSSLFVVSQGDGLVSRVKAQFEKAPEPKRLEILEGNAHAQHIFKTPQGEILMDMITEFLSE